MFGDDCGFRCEDGCVRVVGAEFVEECGEIVLFTDDGEVV